MGRVGSSTSFNFPSLPQPRPRFSFISTRVSLRPRMRGVREEPDSGCPSLRGTQNFNVGATTGEGRPGREPGLDTPAPRGGRGEGGAAPGPYLARESRGAPPAALPGAAPCWAPRILRGRRPSPSRQRASSRSSALRGLEAPAGCPAAPPRDLRHRAGPRDAPPPRPKCRGAGAGLCGGCGGRAAPGRMRSSCQLPLPALRGLGRLREGVRAAWRGVCARARAGEQMARDSLPPLGVERGVVSEPI